jgi:biotin transport system substrate-specific component
MLFLVFSPAEAAMTIGGYLLVGLIGLPVGAGFKGGPAWLFGPTGGFLIGFLAAAIIVGLLRWAVADRSMRFLTSMAFDAVIGLLTIAIYYCCGVTWLVLSTGMALTIAISIAVLPFVVPDGIKLAVAISGARALRKTLGGIEAGRRVGS